MRSPEPWIVAASMVSLILIGPLRGVLAPIVPGLLFLATVTLFMVPGLVLSYLTLERSFPASSRVPLAFTLSVGIFGAPAVPALTLHWSFGGYLLICGGILLVSLVLAVLAAVRRRLVSSNEADFPAGSPRDLYSWLLWAPLLLLGAVFAFISATGILKAGQDSWLYIAWVQDFLGADKLAAHEPFYGHETSFTRIQMSGWLLEHAGFSWLSGIGPVDLTLNYLPPILTAVAVIAFYPLARALLEDGRAAVLATILNALMPVYPYILGLTPNPFGSNFFISITMDKAAVQYIFLPVAVALAVLFLKERGARYLVLFALLCWSVVLVHPIGLVIICFALAGLGIGYLAFDWRERSTWKGLATLALGPLAVVLPVAAYILLTGTSLIELRGSLSNYYSTDPSAIGYMAFTQGRMLTFGDGSFILNPRILLSTFTIAAYLPGIPFLLWHVRRSLTARLLLGIIVFITPLLYFPPLATFAGTYLGPSQLTRLNWCVALTVPVILGWILWEAVVYLEGRMSGPGAARGLAPFLLPAVASVLVFGALLSTAPTIKEHLVQVILSTTGKAPVSKDSCTDPVYRWMDKTITTPSVVLARDRENSCIPAYSDDANVIDIRGGILIRNKAALEKASSQGIEISQRAIDAQRFAAFPIFNRELVRILERYKVDYMLVGRHTLATSIDSRIKNGAPGFKKMDVPGNRYSVYKVNLQQLEVRRPK